MAIFKLTLTLVVLFCLVTEGLGMSVAGKNADEDSALARFFRGLDKREERVGRSGCVDQNDKYFCFFAAVEEDSCNINGHLCAFTCGIC